MHLYIDISSHGLGHLAQTAPVLNALRARLPALRLTIRSGLTHAQLARRVVGDFQHIPQASDFGLKMHDATAVDVEASLAAYRAVHRDWDEHVAQDAAILRTLAPDLVLTNAAYLPLAAAAQARIPAVGMSSINWADIFYPYCAGTPDAAAMRTQMLAAYNSAQAFLRVTPGMPMPDFTHLQPIGPCAVRGEYRRAALQAYVGADERLALVAMGGIAMPLSPATWPRVAGLRWIAPEASGLVRDDVLPLCDIDLTFNDLIASVDCVVTKSGYGTFVEAALAGTPVLYVARPDWPEEPALAQWLNTHGHAQAISRAQLDAGEFGDEVRALVAKPRSPLLEATGIAEATDYLTALLETT